MTHATQHERESTITGHKFFLLFLLLLASLIFYPFADQSRFGYYLLRVLGSAAIVASVYAVNVRRSLLIFIVILAGPALYRHIRFQLFRPNPGTFAIINIALSFVFDVFIVLVIFRRVFTRERATSETIFGALCIYLLVGFSFASVYEMIATLQQNAFYLDPRTNLHIIPDRFDFIYYSYGTMTSLGAAGITPISAQARSFSVLEAILGVLYLAVLVARLIGAYRPGSEL
jgi:hypothetical protein